MARFGLYPPNAEVVDMTSHLVPPQSVVLKSIHPVSQSVMLFYLKEPLLTQVNGNAPAACRQVLSVVSAPDLAKVR